VTLATEYGLRGEQLAPLDNLVRRIEANPGRMVDPQELLALSQGLSMRPAFADLPPELSEEDFIDILRLALLTESATDSYADAIYERAERYDALWLGRFTRDVWVPDELMHHSPYRTMLLDVGFTEPEIDRQIAETQARHFEHASGDTPIHLTTYGMVQEYLTDNWHGLVAKLMRDSVPAAAHMANQIKRRETLHTMWYRDMTALQLEADPTLLRHVAQALVHFHMPSNSLLPDLQSQVPRWLPAMGADFARMTQDLLRHVHAIAGDTRQAGRIAMEVAAERGVRIGPLPPTVIRAALDRLGGPGYGLIGEALLEKVGLGYLYAPPRGFRLDAGQRLALRVRGVLRRWLADRIELDIQPAQAG
jgi:hypothetical protein